MNTKQPRGGAPFPGSALLLSPDQKRALVDELVGYFSEELETDLSPFRGELLLDFMLERLSPAVYNLAILDARAFLSERLEDMEATLYAKPPTK